MAIKPIICIFGGGSEIARKTFKNNFKAFDVLPYSSYTNINKISEYNLLRYKNPNKVLKDLKLKKSSKITTIFFNNLSVSNLLINKSKKELYTEINEGLLKSHELINKILPLMIKNKWGRIIFIGSSRALKGDAGIGGYMASKYAALGYSKSISKEYGKLGITSNYLSLGLFNTNLLKEVKNTDLKNIIRNTDTRSLGDYKSIANAIKFLIKSNYVTGSTINIDGGFM
jgi:NAD(P)-dependent dehydrogenase (short-subunit alcohol dehydrogenase family)